MCLLGFYREIAHYDTAAKLFDWLVQQDDADVDTTVYGEGIIIMIHLGQSLRFGEALFLEGLTRCSHREVASLLRPGVIFR